jgi:Fur family transcriptional regulator, stress-responsive regulator
VPSTSDLEGALRGAGLRVTRPRLAVLAAVHAHPHADTDSLLRRVREDVGPVSHQAVYDVLGALTTAGLVRRFEPAGSVARYEARVGDDHAHVVCRSCGAIADVDRALGSVACRSAPEDAGFAVERTEIVFWGLCPGCLSALNAPEANARTARPQKGPT